MKLTKQRIKQLIKEELENVLNEQGQQADPMDCAYTILSKAEDLIRKSCKGVIAATGQIGTRQVTEYTLSVKRKA